MLQQLKKKNRTDSVLEIFMMSVFEGKNVDEIKQMGYAPSTIYNAHTIFNKHIELRS
jgi:hypothetical protein